MKGNEMMRVATRSFTLILSVVLVLLLPLSQNVRAETIFGTILIQEYSHELFELDFSDTVTLSYDFNVISGPWIDTMLMDENDYANYVEGRHFHYIWHGSAMRKFSAQVSDVVLRAGTYYLVMDNTDLGSAYPSQWMERNATVEYNIDWRIGDPRDTGLLCLFIEFVILGIVGAIFLYLFMKEVRKRGIALLPRVGVEGIRGQRERKDTDNEDRFELNLLYKKNV